LAAIGVGLAATAVAALVPGGPAAADGASFVVTNSASFEQGMPWGGLVSVFTRTSVTSEVQSYAYPHWPTTTADNVRVEVLCNGDTTMKFLPILYVGPNGYGEDAGTQINTYFPNPIDPDEWGWCANNGSTELLVHVGNSRGGGLMQESVSVIASHPGIFAIGNIPDGAYVLNGSEVPLVDCTTGARICPVRFNGTPASMRLLLTGAEAFLCTSCATAGIAFELAPAGTAVYARQTLVSLQRTISGVEQAIVRLSPTLPPGFYDLRVVSIAPFQSAQVLRVRFDPPF
jgi:hypothetical protein